MKRWLGLLTGMLGCLLAVSSVWAQQGEFAGEVDTEKGEVAQDCFSSPSTPPGAPSTSGNATPSTPQKSTGSIGGCLGDLFTGKPFHIGFGSLSPQNGEGLGPALVFEHEPTENWRFHIDADAIATTNLSWRAGVYLNAIHVHSEKMQVTHVTRRPTKAAAVKPFELPLSPGVNVYAQVTSLNKLLYYGEGNFTTVSQESLYVMNEGIVGANTLIPLKNSGLGLFAEADGRFVDIRGSSSSSLPSLDNIYTEATAPGLANQPAFLQFGEGLRYSREFNGRLNLDYAGTLQEFIAPSASQYSFRRYNLDLGRTLRLYGKTATVGGVDLAGPDESPKTLPQARDKKTYVRNAEGTISLDVLLTESMAPAGHSVPFYFQPTLGGTDIDGNSLLLPSYADYRWRAPNAMLFRLSTEHSVWGPIGIMALADAGHVAMTRDDLDFTHFKHSYGVGVTIRAGGLPQVNLVFAWGGHEGTHTTGNLNSSVLGGTERPSLF
ncbi:MAG: hypothetical protein WAO35_07860 [Terriglobia bacterium]